MEAGRRRVDTFVLSCLVFDQLHASDIAMNKATRLLSRGLQQSATSQAFKSRPRVKIVEVSPRDGLQNEAAVLDAGTKAAFIARLAKTGLTFIEAGSFVSPKVKQMANTREVLLSDELRPVLQDGRVTLSVLIPNMRGYRDCRDTIESLQSKGVDTSRIEIAVFASATEGFSRRNLNATRTEALDRLAQVAQKARQDGMKVRGYVSCVVKVTALRPSRVSELTSAVNISARMKE